MSGYQRPLALDGFDAETYWATREFKKWVVILEKRKGKKRDSRTIMVQARTKERAIACARRHCVLKGSLEAYAWLAGPHDLGVVLPKVFN